MTPIYCRVCGAEIPPKSKEPEICDDCYAKVPAPLDMVMPETDEFKKLLKDARDAARVVTEVYVAVIEGLERGTVTHKQGQESNSKAHRDQQAALAAIGSFILGWIGDDM